MKRGCGPVTGKDRASCQSGGAPALRPGAIAQSPGRDTPVFLPGESQGRGSLVGCHLWGRTAQERTGESGAFGLWPHPRGSSRISS